MNLATPRPASVWKSWNRVALFVTLPAALLLTAKGRADETLPPVATTPADDAPPAKDEGSEMLRALQRKGAAYLKFLRDEEGYRLGDDENVKHIPPPFSEARMRWYASANPGQAEAIPRGPDSMLFRWEKGRLKNWGMSFGSNDVDDILNSVAGVYPQRIEGDDKLREMEVAGDWIVRPEAPQEKQIAEIEAILNRELDLKVCIRLAKVEREAYVLRGNYKFAPLPGQPTVDETQLTDRVSRTDPIQVFGKELVPKAAPAAAWATSTNSANGSAAGSRRPSSTKRRTCPGN